MRCIVRRISAPVTMAKRDTTLTAEGTIARRDGLEEPVTVVRVIDHGDDRTTTYYSDGRSYDSEMGWTR